MTVITVRRRADKIAEQWTTLRDLRDAIRDRPIELADGRVFDADPVSIEMMTSTLAQWDDITFMRDEQGRQLWKASDNTVHAFQRSEFAAMVDEVKRIRAIRLDACFAYAEQLRAQLPLPDSHPALRGQGWPAGI